MDEEVKTIDPTLLANLVGIDEGAVPEWGLAILGVLGEDGESRLETVTYGEPSVGTLVGVLEMIKSEIILQVLDSEAE